MHISKSKKIMAASLSVLVMGTAVCGSIMYPIRAVEEELAEQGIKPNTVRLSIGLEHIDDILFDLEEAFKAI